MKKCPEDVVHTYANCVLREVMGSQSAWQVSVEPTNWGLNKHEALPEHVLKITKNKKILDEAKIKEFIRSYHPISLREYDSIHMEEYEQDLVLENLSYILSHPGDFNVSRGKRGLYIGLSMNKIIGRISAEVGETARRCCELVMEGYIKQAQEEMTTMAEFFVKAMANGCVLDKGMLPTMIGIDKDFDTYIEQSLKGGL